MIDLVKEESYRIDAKFLEPACGSGNFLDEILKRKMQQVSSQFKRSILDFERHSILAVSTLYGIDILEDNIEECRNRLLETYTEFYLNEAKSQKPGFLDAIRFIISKNIVFGDALTMNIPGTDNDNKPIKFSEWSLLGSRIKRREYIFREMLPDMELTMFMEVSDTGKPIFIPSPIKEYPLVHYLSLANNDSN